MFNSNPECSIQNNGNTVVRDGEDKFSVGEECFTPTYEKRIIESFNIDNSFGGIRVDWVGGGSSSFGDINKTDAGRQLYLAKELLRSNECSIKYNTPKGICIEGSIHTMFQSVAFRGTPSVTINGEGYIPLQKYLDDVNRFFKGERKPKEEDIARAKEVVRLSGGEVIDRRKKWADGDMKKCFDSPHQGSFEDYINSLKINHE